MLGSWQQTMSDQTITLLRDRASHILCATNTLLKHVIPGIQATADDGFLAGGHSLFVEPKQESIEMANIELHGKLHITRCFELAHQLPREIRRTPRARRISETLG